jgi:membrane-associated phospholipid phosphatase
MHGAGALVLGAWMAAAPLAAQSAVDSARAARDSAIMHRHILPRKDAWLLLGFTAGILAARPLDRTLTERLQRPGVQANRVLSGGATVFRVYAFPGSGVVGGGFYLAGLARHDRTMSEVALHGMEAVVATQGIVNVTKLVAGRARPLVDPTNPHDYKLFRGFHEGDDYRSFPSGHTAAAFAIASAMTAEATDHRPRIRRLVAITTYTAAGFTGLSRMYSNKHWASDVMAGAAVGTLTGMTTVRFNHRHPHNLLDRTLLPRPRADRPVTAMVLPTRQGLAAIVSMPTGRGSP